MIYAGPSLIYVTLKDCKTTHRKQDLKRVCPIHGQYYVKEHGVQPAQQAEGKEMPCIELRKRSSEDSPLRYDIFQVDAAD